MSHRILSRRVRGSLVSVADQTAASTCNFVVAFAIARPATPEQFGLFALIQALIIAAQTVYRGLPGNWILLTPSDVLVEGASERDVRQGAFTLALASGTAVGLAIAVIAAVLSANIPLAVSALILVPALFSITSMRMFAYREAAAHRAMIISISVLVALSTSLLFLDWARFITPWAFPLTVYAGSVALVAIVGAVAMRWSPRTRPMAQFATLGRGDFWAPLFNLLAINARQILVPYAVGLSSGLASVAGLRGAQTIAGLPLQISQGMQPPFTVALARQYDDPGQRRLLRIWTLGQILLLVPVTVASIFVPASIGKMLLGQTWELASPALPWVLGGALLAQLTVGNEVSLRLLGRIGEMTRVRWISLIPTVIFAMAGGWIDSARGAAAGLLLGNLLMLTWSTLLRTRLQGSAGARP